MKLRYGLFVLIFMSLVPRVWALGLAMRFIDITLENVEPGASFNLRALKNLPVVVINQDAADPIDVMVESVIPQGTEMKDGYEPIPDPTWVRVVPDHFRIGPKASAAADIVVTIPNDPKYIGHHYETIVWAHMDTRQRLLATNGVVISPGLRTRFRLSIGTLGPASLQREKLLKKLATINTNFAVNPDSLFLQDVPLGQEVDLKQMKKGSVKIVNQADDAVSLKVSAVEADPNIIPQAGYENAPDYKWLHILTPAMKVEGNAIKEIRLKLAIPDKPEYRGKKFMFLIQTTLADESLPLAYKNMLYVTTAP